MPYNLSSSWLSCIGHECRFVNELVAHRLPVVLSAADSNKPIAGGNRSSAILQAEL